MMHKSWSVCSSVQFRFRTGHQLLLPFDLLLQTVNKNRVFMNVRWSWLSLNKHKLARERISVAQWLTLRKSPDVGRQFFTSGGGALRTSIQTLASVASFVKFCMFHIFKFVSHFSPFFPRIEWLWPCARNKVPVYSFNWRSFHRSTFLEAFQEKRIKQLRYSQLILMLDGNVLRQIVIKNPLENQIITSLARI